MLLFFTSYLISGTFHQSFATCDFGQDCTTQF
jgi:hypothetical protein